MDTTAFIQWQLKKLFIQWPFLELWRVSVEWQFLQLLSATMCRLTNHNMGATLIHWMVWKISLTVTFSKTVDSVTIMPASCFLWTFSTTHCWVGQSWNPDQFYKTFHLTAESNTWPPARQAGMQATVALQLPVQELTTAITRIFKLITDHANKNIQDDNWPSQQ